jgi:hypothetical protein
VHVHAPQRQAVDVGVGRPGKERSGPMSLASPSKRPHPRRAPALQEHDRNPQVANGLDPESHRATRNIDGRRPRPEITVIEKRVQLPLGPPLGQLADHHCNFVSLVHCFVHGRITPPFAYQLCPGGLILGRPAELEG